MVVGLWLLWEFWHLGNSRATMPKKEFKLKVYLLLFYAAMTAYLLNGNGNSRSATSISCLVIGAVVFWQLTVWLKNAAIFWQRVFFFGGAWLVLQPGCELLFGESLYTMTLHAMGRNPTLTDRAQLWHDCITLGMRHPMLGAGYMGFWSEETIAEIKIMNTNAPQEAHNGYLEVFLELGFVGCALFLPVILSGLAGAWRVMRTNFELGQFCVTMLVVMLVHNYSESGFPRPTYLTWFGFLLPVINIGSGIYKTSGSPAARKSAPQNDLVSEVPVG